MVVQMPYASNQAKRHAIILDVDTGEDDALAIILALAAELPLRAVIASYGNTTLENAARNSARVLQLCEAMSIPVVYGAAQPLQPHPFEANSAMAGDFVGVDGLCGVDLPEPDDIVVIATDLAETLDRLLEGDCCDYLVTGPCTNLALLCRAWGMGVEERIGSVWMMGGALCIPGNSGPTDPSSGVQVAEFNMYCDPHAAAEVFSIGLPIALVPWDVTSKVTVSEAQLAEWFAEMAPARFVLQLMQRFFDSYGRAHGRPFELNDPLTVLAYLGAGRFRRSAIRVVTDRTGYGRTVEDHDGMPVEVFELDDPLQAAQSLLQRVGLRRRGIRQA